MTHARLQTLGLAALLVWEGCATSAVPMETLPQDPPLAIVFRTRQQSEDRVELINRRRERARTSVSTLSSEASYLRVEDALEAIGVGGDRDARALLMLGRMALALPDEETAETLPFSLPGARPYDWSADGDRLLFRSLRMDAPQLFEWSRSTGNIRQRTSGPESHPSGGYGPDGRLTFAREALARDGKRGSRIYVTDAESGRARPISPGPVDQKPLWSPDGKVVIFEVHLDRKKPLIASKDPDGDGRVRILGPGVDPTFTPDGKYILYSAQRRGRWRLHLMRPDGAGKRMISVSAYEEHDPMVSPDGAYITYVADDEGRQQLRIRHFDGRGDRPLIFEGDGIYPTWW